MSKKAWIIIASVVVVLALVLIFSIVRYKSKGTIKLGASFPLTGEIASYGIKAKRGIEIAVEERNTKGGILSRQVKVEFQDDRNDKKEGVSIAMRFATIEKVPVIFGSAGSSVSLAMAPVINRHKVVLISPISSSAKLSTEGGPYFFRTVPKDDLQAEILSKWLFEYGAKNVAIIYTNNSWGKPLTEGFEEKYTILGGKVLLHEGVVEGTTDFRTIIAKLKSIHNLDAIIAPTYPKEGAVLVRQVKQIGLVKPLFGGDPWESPEFRDKAGDAAEGIFYTGSLQRSSPAFNNFAERYKAKYGEVPDVFAAYSYDAAMSIFNAMENCGCTEGERIREALLKVSFMGVSGEIEFRPNGDLATATFAKMTIKNGTPVIVGK